MDLAEVAELEAVLLAAWPAAERVDRDGWALLANEGITGRANAICAVASDRVPLADMVEGAEGWHRERGLVPLWRITPLADESAETVLRGRGYGPWPEPTDVLVADLGTAQVTDAAVVSTVAGDAWFAAGEHASRRRAMAAMAARIEGTVGYCSVAEDGRVLAVGQGVVTGRYLSVFGMHTQPDARGRGHGAAVMAALHTWGAGLGATRATLQVTRANTTARGLYSRFGYERRYGYSYVRAAE